MLNFLLKSTLISANWVGKKIKILPYLLPSGLNIKTSEINVSLKLSKKYKIVFISDIHCGWTTKNKLIIKIIQEIIKIKPDCLIIGGDLVEDDAREAMSLVKILKPIYSAGIKILCARGNHDISAKFGSTSTIESALSTIGTRFFINEACSIDGTNLNEKSDCALCFIDEPSKGLSDSNFMRSISVPKILICHNPEILAHGPYPIYHNPSFNDKKHLPFKTYQSYHHEKWFDFGLFGHTHGGQIAKIGTKILQKGSACRLFSSGLFKLQNDSTIFVSSGVGNSALPLRIGIPPEIVLINLN